MDSQNIEFTVEQLLDLHRYWITELWLVDKKSEEEIVTLLHRNQIDVTQHTLHSYLTNWNLLTPSSYYPEGWIIAPNADQPFSIQGNDEYTIVSATRSQVVLESYKQEPRFPLPRTSTTILSNPSIILDANINTYISQSELPSSKLPPPKPVLKGLNVIPSGFTPLEFFSLDWQDYDQRTTDLESSLGFWDNTKEKRRNEPESSCTKKIKRAATMRSRKLVKSKLF